MLASLNYAKNAIRREQTQNQGHAAPEREENTEKMLSAESATDVAAARRGKTYFPQKNV